MNALNELKDQFDNTDLEDHCECLSTALEYYDGDKDAISFIEWYREEYIDLADVIDYDVAAEYLKENDPSLRESMELAQESGYEINTINSELLANLLMQENLYNQLADLGGVLQDYFDELEESEAV